MREILFRGKRIDNGEWVYGDLVHVENKNYISYYYESPLSTFINEMIEYDGISIVGVAPFIEVDLITIGQYTGLTDKNGKRIFEGDIVRNHNGQIYEMVFIEKYNCYYFVRESSVYAGIKPKDIEVIGNIHDNPELLEVRE